MLLPGAGFDVVPTDCLSLWLKNRLPNASKLEMAFVIIGSGLSRGTSITTLQKLGLPGVPGPPAAARSIGEPVTWSTDGPGGSATAALASGGTFGVEVVAPDGCGRFVARVLRGLDPAASSPAWLQARLTALGMRPLSALVDISNYVMLELGQPNHPYDLAKVAGSTLRARRARDGETLVTLDDVERHFTADDLLITDGDDVAVGIAGVMGGAACEIDDTTTDVLLELAWFDPTSVSRTSRRLGPPLGGLGPLREGRRPRHRRPGGGSVLPAGRRDLRGHHRARADRRPGPPAGPARGDGPHRPGERPPRHRPVVGPHRASCWRRSASRPGRSATTTWSPSRPGGTTRPARSTSSRRWPATTGTATSRTSSSPHPASAG